MIDPTDITHFGRSHAELEEFLLNAIAFAGKNARQQAPKMHALIFAEPHGPFENIRRWVKNKTLRTRLVDVKIGKYALLEKSFTVLAHSHTDLTTCTVEELIQFPAIGHKTARLFILHSRPHQKYAVIDTHLLKEMRLLKMTTLRATPANNKYAELEKILLDHLTKIGITDFAEYDLSTWKKYALKKVNRRLT